MQMQVLCSFVWEGFLHREALFEQKIVQVLERDGGTPRDRTICMDS